ncbi:MAG TPA: isoprenylcysteine carboxylmethyltransferase family protein, partial [Candidatus Limnocylindrales bacterium]|nr:isoprenylcysteine carboxylmethyltransferase family protein [Candidatus Limnocylindrales bacterium]
IFIEGLVSFPAFAALPPDRPLGWLLLGAGLLLLLAGGWLVYRGIDDLGRNLTALPAPVRDATLVDDGVYARVRHPIYAGVITLGVGWAIALGSPAALLVAILLAGWLDLKSRREEVWLSEHHPGYASYRSRTSRFVPGLY